ncbi:MAG: phosphatidate cytidylyltransferase [Alphaproteobacteria bacterium]|nr:phosphatidate cytidylyltransferase [Alphaproteobacteria bacterium]
MSGDDNPPAGQVKSTPELTLRLLAAAILIPVVILGAWAGGIWFTLLIALVIGLAGHEWARLCGVEKPMMVLLLSALGPIVAIALVFVGAAAGIIVIVAGLLIAGVAGAGNRIWLMGGIVYLGLPTLAILILRADPVFGLAAVATLFGIVWLTDTGAYAFGRLIGGPRLAPTISPSKTWAGAFGGLFLAMAGIFVMTLFLDVQVPISAIALAALLSTTTQCGDLFESWVKRRFDKKDSGAIIPGHGGILDRIDGLIFAAPVMAAILIGRGGTVPLWP